LALALAQPALGQSLRLPDGTQQLAERPSPAARYALPTGVAAEERVPARSVEGRVLRRTWRFVGEATTLQIFAPLREQIAAGGYQLLLDCMAQQCGGFDFRFGIEVVPAPDMAVDIRDFQFLSAEHPDGRSLSLLVSRSGNAAYVQLIEVSAADQPPWQVEGVLEAAPVVAEAPQDPPEAAQDVAADLQRIGRVVLEDLEFRTGATALGDGPFASLSQLAELLQQDPEARVALVGHTDTVGSLEDNLALSQKRAEAVRGRLIEEFSLPPGQIEAAGAGYLAPRDSNATAAGRERNRRVEAVLVSR
jgi:OOP family OmpA-OmpF porin